MTKPLSQCLMWWGCDSAFEPVFLRLGGDVTEPVSLL